MKHLNSMFGVVVLCLVACAPGNNRVPSRTSQSTSRAQLHSQHSTVITPIGNPTSGKINDTKSYSETPPESEKTFVAFNRSANETTSQKSIISPAPQFDVPDETFVVNAETGGSFTYSKTGSTILIPAHSLVDENGNMVYGNVEVKYREFHSLAEIYFSGIPMHYDVNGERQYFESAGMVQIQATQNKEKLFIKKDKSIEINMSTDNTNEGVNLYQLDTLQKTWKEIGKPPVINNNTTSGFNLVKTAIPKYNSKKVKKIRKAPINLVIEDYLRGKDEVTGKLQRFIIFKLKISRNRAMKNGSNKQDYITAQYFSRIKFKLKGAKKNAFKKAIADLHNDKDHKWYRSGYPITADITIVPTQKQFEFDLTLTNPEDKKSITLTIEMVKTKHQSVAYQTGIFNKLVDFPYNSFAGRNYKYNGDSLVVVGYDSVYMDQSYANRIIIQRQFQVYNFGILNCDQPKALPKEMIANAHFKNGDDDLPTPYVTLADMKQKCLFTYYDYKYSSFGFDPDANNLLFTTLSNNLIGYITPEEFKKIQKSGYLNIPFHVVPMDEFALILKDYFPDKTTKDFEKEASL